MTGVMGDFQSKYSELTLKNFRVLSKRRKTVARKKVTISLQDVLYDRYEEWEKEPAELGKELDSDLKALFDTLNGYELANAVIVRIHRYAAERADRSADDDFRNATESEIELMQEIVGEELFKWISHFITDSHREFIVRCHAKGLSTTDAALELLKKDMVIARLAQKDALGVKRLHELLVHRLSYLKPGAARWPEKKYGAIWREAREEHKQVISDIPFTSQVEQVATLAKHVERINEELDDNSHNVKDLQVLTHSLTETLESLKKLSVVEEQPPVNLSAPQLVAVLERLTLALDAPEQLALSGDADALVSVLEQLTLALKVSGQKALGDGTEASVQEVEVVSVEGGGDSSASA